jgi:hypothetical protein
LPGGTGNDRIGETRDAVVEAIVSADLDSWQRRVRPVGIASMSTSAVVKTWLLRCFDPRKRRSDDR